LGSAVGVENPRESKHDGARFLGQTLKRGQSLREAAKRPNRTCRYMFEYREVDRFDNHVAGAFNPYDARAWRLLREAW